jgi:hypothetical protein
MGSCSPWPTCMPPRDILRVMLHTLQAHCLATSPDTMPHRPSLTACDGLRGRSGGQHLEHLLCCLIRCCSWWCHHIALDLCQRLLDHLAAAQHLALGGGLHQPEAAGRLAVVNQAGRVDMAVHCPAAPLITLAVPTCAAWAVCCCPVSAPGAVTWPWPAPMARSWLAACWPATFLAGCCSCCSCCCCSWARRSWGPSCS